MTMRWRSGSRIAVWPYLPLGVPAATSNLAGGSESPGAAAESGVVATVGAAPDESGSPGAARAGAVAQNSSAHARIRGASLIDGLHTRCGGAHARGTRRGLDSPDHGGGSGRARFDYPMPEARKPAFSRARHRIPAVLQVFPPSA